MITDEACKACKESKSRDTEYLVELPNSTRKQRLKVSVCPHCDGKELIKLAMRDEQEGSHIS